MNIKYSDFVNMIKKDIVKDQKLYKSLIKKPSELKKCVHNWRQLIVPFPDQDGACRFYCINCLEKTGR